MTEQTKKTAPKAPPAEQAVVGMNYRKQRFEPGDRLTDNVPESSRVWLREQGLIKPYVEPKAPKTDEGVS